MNKLKYSSLQQVNPIGNRKNSRKTLKNALLEVYFQWNLCKKFINKIFDQFLSKYQ